MDTVEAIRLIALRDVLRPSSEYNLRYLFRWYSKTFATPLHEVANIDTHEILQAYFEEKFESMDAEEREEARLALLTPDDEQAKAEAEKEAAAAADKKAEEELVKESLAANAMDGLEKIHDAPIPLEELNELPQNVKMEFIDDEEMERLLQGGMATQTRKRDPII